MNERIQKALATAGVASRREIERLIDEGRIEVNGKAVELGYKVAAGDRVRVDGRLVELSQAPEPVRVLLYKKRVGEIVTRDDPEGRRTVFRKLPKLDSGRWIAVGRLDLNTSGLLLFTNNGELARRLTHPSFEVTRVYAVRILGTVDEAVIKRWTSGIELEDGPARFERVEAGENEDGEGANQWFHVTVREGRNRFVRRVIESQDLQVSRLIRIAYGPIELGRGIKSGTAREATPAERLALLDAVSMPDDSAVAKRGNARRGAAHVERVSEPGERAKRPGREPVRAASSSRRGESDERGGAVARPSRGPQPRGSARKPSTSKPFVQKKSAKAGSRRPEGAEASAAVAPKGKPAAASAGRMRKGTSSPARTPADRPSERRGGAAPERAGTARAGKPVTRSLKKPGR